MKGDFSLGKFNVLLQPECWSSACGEILVSGPLETVLSSMQESPDVISSKVRT